MHEQKKMDDNSTSEEELPLGGGGDIEQGRSTITSLKIPTAFGLQKPLPSPATRPPRRRQQHGLQADLKR